MQKREALLCEEATYLAGLIYRVAFFLKLIYLMMM